MKIVIKVGTSTLTDKEGLLNKKYIADFAAAVSEMAKNGHDIIIVSSGAIGAGLGHLRQKTKPKTLREKQALAAIGQPLVMNAYNEAFAEYGITAAQLLLTRDDFDSRTKYINARNTMSELVEKKIIPIINENDTIAVEEINFGDNDTLGALAALAVDADTLIILTDVDGLYDGFGGGSGGKLIGKVENITEEIESLASSKSSSGKGAGGMKTKITAAKIASASGINTIIINGMKLKLLKDIIERKEVGTEFAAGKKPLEAKKSWIAFGKKAKGYVFVDKKAAEALTSRGKSLLAAGVTGVCGNFKRGDTVIVAEKDTKKDFARGLINYGCEDMLKIKGKNTKEIKKIITAGEDEVIHRDNLVIL
ncbi:MAG: glutamate 5-kinase [Endomicrobia bacterium]|nr:glutamate 5-kinase [Endomicrobiia bacterium]